MDTYDFKVRLDRAPTTDADFDVLFESGLSDSSPITTPDGRGYLLVTRESDSMANAIISTVADIRKAGFEAIGIETEDLMTLAGLGRKLGRTRESMRLLASGKRGPGGFPQPLSSGSSPLYSWAQVRTWMADHKLSASERDEDSDTIIVADLLMRAHSLMPNPGPLTSLIMS